LFYKTELSDDLKQASDALIAQTQKRICQLMDVELQSCWLSTYFGYLGLRTGSVDRAKREVEEVERRCLRLLPDVADEEQRNEFKAQLDSCCPR